MKDKKKEPVVFAHAQAAKGGTGNPGQPSLTEEDLEVLLGTPAKDKEN